MTDAELIDALCEMYPGEVPDNKRILIWILDLKEKAYQYDEGNQRRGFPE